MGRPSFRHGKLVVAASKWITEITVSHLRDIHLTIWQVSLRKPCKIIAPIIDNSLVRFPAKNYGRIPTLTPT